jgi:hypothetical protein
VHLSKIPRFSVRCDPMSVTILTKKKSTLMSLPGRLVEHANSVANTAISSYFSSHCLSVKPSARTHWLTILLSSSARPPSRAVRNLALIRASGSYGPGLNIVEAQIWP